jgi:hypothetical protein
LTLELDTPKFNDEDLAMSSISNEEKRAIFLKALAKAKTILKEGDRFRCERCGGIKRTYTFSHFDGNCIVSKSGIYDLAAPCIDRLNGKPIDFTK